MSFPKGYGLWAFLVWEEVYILEPGMVFEGIMGVNTCESICRFNSKWVRKREKYANLNCIQKFFWSSCTLI